MAVLGIVVGAFASRLYWPSAVLSKPLSAGRPSPEEWRHQYLGDMQKRLNLTPDQLTQLNKVLDEIGQKVHTEHERHTQEMKTVREEHVTRVRAILTPAQLPEYEKLRQEREQRAKALADQQAHPTLFADLK